MSTNTASGTNLKIFAAISLFIWGVVGVVLCVVNLNQTPADTGLAVVFGSLGAVGFVGGWLLTRKPSH